MRLKAIPAELEHIVAVHPYWVGLGAVVIGVGAYHYINNRNPVDYYNADPTASTQQAFTYGMPQMMPSDGATGLIDAIINPNAPISTGGVTSTPNTGGSSSVTTAPSNTSSPQTVGDLTNMDIFNFEKLKEQHDYDLATASLAASIYGMQANADIAMMGIQANNWQTSAGLAEAFLRSGNQFAAGNVGGQTFAFLAGGATGAQFPGISGKGLTRDIQTANANFLRLLSNPTIQGMFSNVQPQSGAISITPTGGATVTSALPALGGNSAAPSLSSVSAGSAQPAIYNASAYSPASFGGSGSGGESGNFRLQLQ